MSDLLTVPEAAEYLRINRMAAYKMIREDRFPIPVLRIGKNIRIARHELDRFVGTPTTGDARD